MENIFELAERVLYQSDIEEKIQLTRLAQSAEETGSLSLTAERPVKDISSVCFPAKPELLPPKEMPRRSLHTTAGKAAFFHALAHI